MKWLYQMSNSSSPESNTSGSISPSHLEAGLTNNSSTSSNSNNISSSSSSSSYGAYPSTIITGEHGSDSGSGSDTTHDNHNIIISTPNVPNATLDIENETQLIKYLDSFDSTGAISPVPVRFSSYYTHNDDIDAEDFWTSDRDHDHERERNYISNSPVSMSPCGSDDGTEEQTGKFKRLTYADVEKAIEKYYNPSQKFSNEFDILVTYLKGQKNLYIQSKNITQFKLNLLVFPSILLTAFLTIFAPTISMRGWSIYFVSAVNAFIAVLVSLINYLKLESKTEMYAQLANQYDKLETAIELSSNKLFFMSKETDQSELILNKIKYIENKLSDIKESNNSFLIPEEVKKVFPIIYHVNIFSFIKKIETYKKKLVMQFKDVKNEIGYIIYKWNQKGVNIFEDENIARQMKPLFVKEQGRLMYLMKTKEKIKYDLLCYKNSYAQIDELFIREIKNAGSFYVWICALCFGEYEKPVIREANPVIEEFLQRI